MTRRTHVARLVVGAALAVVVQFGVVSPPAAQAYYDGYCKDDAGVTVVVDYQALGGGTVIRCADNFPAGGTGFDALHRAGFSTQGTSHDGEGFICRIAGRPSATETIPVKKYPKYKERCIDTPPAAAYWSYWHAPNGGSWSYSNYGAKNRAAIIGGFEGWSFSLNATASTNPQPRVSPRRPSAPPPVTPSAPAKPPAKPTGAAAPNASGEASSSGGNGSAAPARPTGQRTGAPTAQPPTPATPAAASPDAPDASGSASAAASPVNGSAESPNADPATPPPSDEADPDPGGGSPPVGTIVGAIAVVVLAGAAIGVAVWRRRTR